MHARSAGVPRGSLDELQARGRRLDQPVLTSLEQLVPPDNFYRQLETKLDLSFVREWVYMKETKASGAAWDIYLWPDKDQTFFINVDGSNERRIATLPKRSLKNFDARFVFSTS